MIAVLLCVSSFRHELHCPFCLFTLVVRRNQGLICVPFDLHTVAESEHVSALYMKQCCLKALHSSSCVCCRESDVVAACVAEPARRPALHIRGRRVSRGVLCPLHLVYCGQQHNDTLEFACYCAFSACSFVDGGEVCRQAEFRAVG